MNHWVASTASLLLVFSISLLPGPPVRAQSIGLAPGSLEVVDALRGAEYTRQFTLINQLPDLQTYDLELEGSAASWITLYDANNRTVPVDRIDSLPGEGFRAVVKLVIPDDAPNGRHVAEISMRPSGQAVGTGLALDFTIDVTGTQRLEGSVIDVSVPDTEVGLPLRASMDFINTGNVFAEPIVKLWILDEDANLLEVVTDQDQVIDVESSSMLEAEWDTVGRQPGQYLLGLEVLLDETEVFSAPLEFQLWPEGHFTRQGELASLQLTNAPDPGAAARIAAIFRNTGEVDTLATFVGEVYRDDVLIGTAGSSELVAETGSGVQLDVIVPVEERGEYRVEGFVNFEGKESNTASLSFKVPPDFGSGGFLGRPWWQVVAGGLVAAIVLYAVAVESRKRWKEMNT